MKRLFMFFIALAIIFFLAGFAMARDHGRGSGHPRGHPGGGQRFHDRGHFHGDGHFDRGYFGREHFHSGHNYRDGYYPGYYGNWPGWDYGHYRYWVPGYWIWQWDDYYGQWVKIWVPGYWSYY